MSEIDPALDIINNLYSAHTGLIHALNGQHALIVPGLHNSDEQHWQSLWHAQIPNSTRIELDDWDKPVLEKWRAAIRLSLAQQEQPVVIIAHSFGALAAASIAAESPEKISALFLVAPADPDKFGIRELLPATSLQVPAKIIASDNDPWISAAKAAFLALLWRADFLRIRQLGHINSASNIGYWPEGIHELHALLHKAQQETGANAPAHHQAA